MAHDHSACPNGANEKEWTAKQSGGVIGPCYQCGNSTYLRLEPFSQQECCKTCWELIVYGDED
jgi:hypothetical protein